MSHIRIGTAGWSIPRSAAGDFVAEGSNLARYARRFSGVEINSSFYRSHRFSTWQKWRETVPDGFRFSVKMPKLISHQRRLIDCGPDVGKFLEEAQMLGSKLGVVLVQLPPNLIFDPVVAEDFFESFRSLTSVPLACEPRHSSWFDDVAADLLLRFQVSRVAADPAVCPEAANPGGCPHLAYWRLHGTPHLYRSSYGDRLKHYGKSVAARAEAEETWCIFDNTASSAAIMDALTLQGLL